VSYRHFGRVTPFGEVLFGVTHAGASIAGTSGSDNAFAMSLGGGLDCKLNHHFAIRPIKVDYLITRFPETGTSNQTQNNLRVSTGIVFRF
jgi:opacity protein-like surface antigen